MRESIIENYAVARIEEMGGEVRKVSWPGRRGAPDRVVMLPGRFLAWIEFKAPGKGAEAHQQREHARMRGLGQVVLVISSIEGVDRFLSEVKA